MSLLVCAVALALSSAPPAIDLTGRWEVQSIGADRELTVEQHGNKIVAHRVMWPEFNGKPSKLEHLYKGKLAGSKITGNLMVREEGQKDYELLRPFVGEVTPQGDLNLDGLPLKRLPPRDPANQQGAEPSPGPPGQQGGRAPTAVQPGSGADVSSPPTLAAAAR